MRRGRDAKARLARHDSYGFFAALGDLVVTGPTRTEEVTTTVESTVTVVPPPVTVTVTDTGP